MKKYLFLISLFIINVVVAQTTEQFKFTANTLVKDSVGNIYPPEKWQPLVHTRYYGLKPLNPANKEEGFLIYYLSKEERNKRDVSFFNTVERYPMPSQSQFFTNGKTIESFRAKDLNGNKISLKELQGKIVVLNFWFIKCPPCKAEIPVLNSIVEHFEHNLDIVFIAIGLDNKYEIKDFIKTNPFNYDIIDDGRFIAQQYGIHLYPTHVIIDQKGIVRFSSSGGGSATALWLKKSIDELVNEKTAAQ